MKKRIALFMGYTIDPSGIVTHELTKILSRDYQVHDYYSGGNFDCVIAPESLSMTTAITTVPKHFLIEDRYFIDEDFEYIKAKINERIGNQ